MSADSAHRLPFFGVGFGRIGTPRFEFAAMDFLIALLARLLAIEEPYHIAVWRVKG